MRIINRMIEPDGGTVMVAGRDIMNVDPVELRRSIGYVIQQIGLFPHWSIAREHRARCRACCAGTMRASPARVDELLALVGMDPAQYRDRFPRELSGGQRQRIGVARALAADPPVMLMDEPFGAIDPITRARLQDEFLNILRALSKTDRVRHARYRRGAQDGRPRSRSCATARWCSTTRRRRSWRAPADAFVEAFVGTDRALKRLALVDARDAALEPLTGRSRHARAIGADASLRDALALMFSAGVDALAVVGARRRDAGRSHAWRRIRTRTRIADRAA